MVPGRISEAELREMRLLIDRKNRTERNPFSLQIAVVTKYKHLEEIQIAVITSLVL